MAKEQCNFPTTLDVLDVERETGQIIYGDDMDIVETAITNIEKYVVFSKFDAIIPPTVDDDYDEGFRVGSRWVDIVGLTEWICIDPTNGAAVWVQTSNDVFNSEAISVRVKAGEDLKKGQAVYVSGAYGNNPVVNLVDNTEVAKSRIIGVAATDILNNAIGLVRRGGDLLLCDTRQGQDINDDALDWVAGDLLYSCCAGKLTKVRPTSGRILKVAYSIKGSGVTDILLIYPHENPTTITGAVGEDITLGLGDDIGVNKITVKNYSGVEKANINSLGASLIPKIDLSGGQIKFPATANPSADPNTQDDYEEGEWAPGIKFGGASVGMTYSLQEGLYIKVGRKVTLTGLLLLSSKGSSTGAAIITGHPFSSKNDIGAYSSVSLVQTRMTFANVPLGFVVINSSHSQLVELTEAGVRSNLSSSDFADDTQIVMNIIYYTG